MIFLSGQNQAPGPVEAGSHQWWEIVVQITGTWCKTEFNLLGKEISSWNHAVIRVPADGAESSPASSPASTN